MINVFTNEEAASGNKILIPHGTLARFRIETDGAVKDKGDRASTMWKLIATEGPYKGVELYDFIGIKGKDYYVTRGKNAMMYALDINRGAHLKLPDDSGYQIESYKEFNGMEVIAKVKIEVDSMQKDNGEIVHFHRNAIDHYCTPRADSSTYKCFGAYQAGDQRWQTDEKPPLPTSKTNGIAQNGSYDYATQDIPL